MKSSIAFSLLLLTALAAIAAYAADPTPPAGAAAGGPTAAPPCEPPEAVVPKRQLVFDQSDDEYSVEQYNVGPPGGEMMPGGMMPGGMVGVAGRPITSLVPENAPLHVAVLNLQFKFPPTHRNQPPVAMTPEQRFIQQVQGPQSELLRLLVNQTPQDRLPSKEILFELTQNADLFVRPTVVRGVSHGSGIFGAGSMGSMDAAGMGLSASGTSVNSNEVHLQIIAPTPQRAKEYATAILTLYDYGLSYPIYCGIQQLPASYSSSLEAARKKLVAAKARLAGSEEELKPLKGYEDITQESIGNLVSQQRMVEVDLAGIKARIEACNKLLSSSKPADFAADRPRMPASRVEQVETVKVGAEIDLVGLAARKEAIERLVANGRRRIFLVARNSGAFAEVDRWQRHVAEAEFPIEAAKMARDEKLPFAQVQGKVLVRRVKWVEPTRMGMPGMGGMGGGMSMPGMMSGAAQPRRATGTAPPNASSQRGKSPGASGTSVPSTKEPKSDP